MTKKHIAGIVALVVVGASIMGMNLNQAIAVDAFEVKRGTFTDTFREDGVVYAKDERPAVAQVGGIVEAVYVESGDHVLVGDILLTFNTRALELQKKAIEGQIISIEGQLQAESEKIKTPDIEAQKRVVSIARDDMEKSTLDWARAEALYETGAISRQAYEAAEQFFKASKDGYEMEKARLESLQSQNDVGDGLSAYYAGQIMQLKAQQELIEDEIEKSTLKADMAGTVTELDLEVGQAVLPMTPVVNIMNTEHVEIESMVLAEEALGLSVGDFAQIIQTRKGVEQIAQAQIIKMDPVAVETISALGLKERRVRVTVSPEKGTEMHVIAGADVDVAFTAYQSDAVFSVPKSSVFPTQSGDGLWLIRDGKIVLQNIETGYEARRFIEVLSGLEEGDCILKTYDTDGIEEGRKVKPVNL